MLMTLGLGAEVDIATADELAHGLKDVKDSILGKHPPHPTMTTRVAAVPGTGATATLNLGSPPVGRIWEITAVTVCGNTVFTAFASPATKVALYTGNPYAPGIASIKMTNLAIPSTSFPSSSCIYCHSNQELFAVTDAAVNTGDTIAVVVEIKEWRESDVSSRSGRP